MRVHPIPGPRPVRLSVLLIALALVPRLHPPDEPREVVLEPTATSTAIESAYDVQFATVGGVPLLLDVHRPAGAKRLPAIILIHGGRWRSGDKAELTPIAQEWAALGYAVFNVNYRLARAATRTAPGITYTALLQDVRSAISWVRQNGSAWGADPAAVGILGGSAGSHLGLLAAVQDPSIGAVASWSGPTDLELMWSQGQETEAIGTLVGCTHPNPCPAIRDASPISHVTSDDPPALLANGSDEQIPVEQATRMAEALEAVGVEHEVLIPQTELHGWGLDRYAEEPTRAFFARHLCDPGPQPTIAAPDVASTEAAGAASISLTLPSPTCRDVKVSFSTRDQTAVAGQDYKATSGSLVIPAGSTAGTITVPLFADSVDEPDERFTVTLSSGAEALLPDPNVDVTITGQSGPSLSVNDTSKAEGNSGTTGAVFSVRLSEPVGHPVSVSYSTANGTAVAGRDYRGVSGSLIIPAGKVTATVVVVLVGDTTWERNETYALVLSSPQGATIGDGQGRGIIVNDDSMR
jgi:acetyl esterase/lipase